MANTIGAATGLAITLAVISMSSIDKDRDITLVLVITTAVFIAVSQWFMVRRYVSHAVLWIAASVLGLLMGGITIGIAAWIVKLTIGVERMSNVLRGEFALVVPLILYGASVGFIQWLFLRQHLVHPDIKWWALASILGAVLLAIYIGDTMGNIAEVILFGTIPAIFTGIVWARIRPQLSFWAS